MAIARIDHPDFKPTQQLVALLATVLGDLGTVSWDEDLEAYTVWSLATCVEINFDAIDCVGRTDWVGMLRVLDVVRSEVEAYGDGKKSEGPRPVISTSALHSVEPQASPVEGTTDAPK